MFEMRFSKGVQRRNGMMKTCEEGHGRILRMKKEVKEVCEVSREREEDWEVSKKSEESGL